ncbi:S9 family peptidase [candidate division KSB1 bacterium]|nr:MAG: S9 family peptidase [candidate division KSB1 bacterium]
MKKNTLISIICLFNILILFNLTNNLQAQKKLTLEWISKDSYKTIGMSPSRIHWSENGKRIYFYWNPEKNKDASLYWVAPEGGKPVKVPEEELWKLPEGRGNRNKQETFTVYSKYGDIFLMDIQTGKVKRLFRTEKAETNPRFTPDGKSFTFESDGNLFLYKVKTGEITQLTNFKKGNDPEKKPKGTKLQEYLKKQQEELFDYIKRIKEDRKRQKERIKKQNPKPKPYYLGKDKKAISLELSPDGKYVSFLVEDISKIKRGRIPRMPRWITESGFVETQELIFGSWRRMKVGEPVTRYTLGLYNVKTGDVKFADAGFGKLEINYNEPKWSEDGSMLVFPVGSVDNKDKWLIVMNPESGKCRTIFHEHDEAWIRDMRAGRGGSLLGWLPDNDRIFFTSERDGWWHLYTISVSSGELKQLTKGNWEIYQIKLSKNKDKFYMTTTEVHPGERHLYSISVDGKSKTRITPVKEGWFNFYLSPDESKIALTYSYYNKPPELYIMENVPGAPMKQLTDSTTPEFKALELPPLEIVTFPDKDGNLIYGTLYKPKDPHPIRPAVLYIHGAGYAQAVYKRWGRTLFQYFLMQNGYTVLSVDYRGSSGYGRACRTAIYRYMGDKDVQSSLSAIKYLVENHNVNPDRIGIYGGSYGGFYTLMALFLHPGKFSAGIAIVPVTDWAHYNHGYTSRILNLPYDDEEAYKRSSPIYFAGNLQDHLLIMDGMVDGNVLFLDTVRLVEKLIELGKDNWDYHIYPVEGHGWRQEYSKLDANKRMFRFFEEILKK